DQPRPPRLPRPVRKDLRPLDGHVVAVDGRELDGERPVLEPDHAGVEPLGDGLDAFDATVGRIDVDDVVGEEAGEVAPLAVAGVDLAALLDVVGDDRFDLLARMSHTPATRP